MFNPFKKIKELEKRINDLENNMGLYKMGDFCKKCKNYMPPDKFSGGHSCYYCRMNDLACKGFEPKK